MKLYVHRLPGSIEFTLKTDWPKTHWRCLALAWRGRYWSGRRWTYLSDPCICCWYGPDLYDGCSECGPIHVGKHGTGLEYTTGCGQRMVSVHAPEDCEGRHCVIHNPSDHALADCRTYWRSDRQIMERICEHGVGHPDPDDAAFRASRGDDDTTHGCDGCCGGVYTPLIPEVADQPYWTGEWTDDGGMVFGPRHT